VASVTAALLLGSAPPGSADGAETAAGSVTVVLVRHAEKADDGTRDPGLSSQGQARAAELARVLSDLRITHLFASEYQRTQLTLAPLAEKTGLAVQERSARAPAELVEELRALPDAAVVVVAGHSNTVPDLVQRLGGAPTGLEEHPKYGWLLPEDEYGRLFVVTLTRTGGQKLEFANCLELRYGSE